MKRYFDDFKSFAIRGNVIDLAVGVIIGAAFGKIVDSLVKDVIMPVIGIFVGGIDFTELSFGIDGAQVMYGRFLQTFLDLIIVAAVLFVLIKVIKRLRRQKQTEPPKEEDPEDIRLLREIRDLLKK